MSIFTEKLVPNGWTRGEVLRINRMTGKNLSVVATIWQAEFPEIGSIPANSIACLTVLKGQEADADNWLKWWHE